MCSFYLTWFNRIYMCGDTGWYACRTPDGRPLTQQDAFFWFAMEVVAKELNAMRAAELAKMNPRG